jgi:hypothetical protein
MTYPPLIARGRQPEGATTDALLDQISSALLQLSSGQVGRRKRDAEYLVLAALEPAEISRTDRHYLRTFAERRRIGVRLAKAIKKRCVDRGLLDQCWLDLPNGSFPTVEVTPAAWMLIVWMQRRQEFLSASGYEGKQ